MAIRELSSCFIGLGLTSSYLVMNTSKTDSHVLVDSASCLVFSMEQFDAASRKAAVALHAADVCAGESDAVERVSYNDCHTRPIDLRRVSRIHIRPLSLASHPSSLHVKINLTNGPLAISLKVFSDRICTSCAMASILLKLELGGPRDGSPSIPNYAQAEFKSIFLS